MPKFIYDTFPGNEIDNRIRNIQDIFEAAKPLVIKLFYKQTLRELILNYLSEIQVLLHEIQESNTEYNEQIFNEHSQGLDERHKAQERELKELDELWEKGEIPNLDEYSKRQKVILKKY